MKNLGLSILASALFFVGGIFFHGKFFPVPDCVCPKIPPCPQVSLQSIDINKIKGVRGFTLNQTFQVKLDSVDIERMIRSYKVVR